MIKCLSIILIIGTCSFLCLASGSVSSVSQADMQEIAKIEAAEADYVFVNADDAKLESTNYNDIKILASQPEFVEPQNFEEKLIPKTKIEAKVYENKLFTQQANLFSSPEQKVRYIEMAKLAWVAYGKNTFLEAGLEEGDYVLLPSPQALGITVPTGFRVVAFQKGGEIIFAVRGTELTGDYLTLAKNLLADMGIGRHKTNDDLKKSLQKTCSVAKERYGYDSTSNIKTACGIIDDRISGKTNGKRAMEATARVVKKSFIGAGWGGLGGAITGGIVGAGAIAAGIISAPVLAPIATVALWGMVGVGSWSTAKETVKCLTAFDGFSTLLSYIKTLVIYHHALQSLGYIGDHSVAITGHSLGGYLAGIVGGIFADEAFSFNGPGIADGEVEKIIAALGTLQYKGEKIPLTPTNPVYYSTTSEADFIGNLGERVSSGIRLSNFITKYENPLAHHGIEELIGVLELAHVSQIYQELSLSDEEKMQLMFLMFEQNQNSGEQPEARAITY